MKSLLVIFIACSMACIAFCLEPAEESKDGNQRGLADDKLAVAKGYSWTGSSAALRMRRDVSWQNGNGGFTVPSNAVQGGYLLSLKKPLYVCHAWHNNGNHPGKLFQTARGWACLIGWGGNEHEIQNFQVLVNTCGRSGAVTWSDGRKDFSLPSRTVVGGAYQGHVLYVCRAWRGNTFHPGKLFGGNNNWKCYYPWGGKEHVADSFQVLVDSC